jgi:hypothetical protein
MLAVVVSAFGPVLAELRRSDRRGNSAQCPNQGFLSATSLDAQVNRPRAAGRLSDFD